MAASAQCKHSAASGHAHASTPTPLLWRAPQHHGTGAARRRRASPSPAPQLGALGPRTSHHECTRSSTAQQQAQAAAPWHPAPACSNNSSRSRRACHLPAAWTPSATLAPAHARPTGSAAKGGAASGNQQPQKATLTLFYRTSWPVAVLHGSVMGGPWADYPLQPHPSAPKTWQRCTFQLPPAALEHNSNGNGSTKLLEFVLTNKAGDWDKPGDGGNYAITQLGAYSVSDGHVSKVAGARVMVVSDLDGTMVGDDAATAAFTQWWRDVAIPRGGALVYNTGRSLESFLELLEEKKHCLAVPDALISAVGTKIYEHDAAASGQFQWQEDAVWLTQLEEGWRLEAAREACYRALAEVGKERMHFRPPEEQGSHKVTCGLRADALRPTLDVLESNLAIKGVRANVITSGHGQWRYVDIVPVRAGKLSALNYVRRRFGFLPMETVACGDSGNDILMLQGDNPAIVVGNAQQDLQDWYHQRHGLEPHGNGPDGKQRLFMARRPEALGILEGLQHWGFK